MPRRRSIACAHCGFLQLKRDTECEQCGRMTAGARRKLIAGLVYAGVVLATVAVLFQRLQSFGAGQ